MTKHEVKVNVHTNCLGTEREGKPIMLSLDGKNSKGAYVCLDAFLTKDEAISLVKSLQDVIDTLK